MNNLLSEAVYFGTVLTLVTFLIGVVIQKKTKLAIMNPILISMLLCIAVLKIFRIDYEVYNKGASTISWFLTPATICLAVPLYEKVEELKKNALAIVAGILSGVLTNAVGVIVLSKLFRLDHRSLVSLMPKSITTAIGIGLCEELNGYVALTVLMIVITGITGNVVCESFLKLLHITEPVAKGIGIGSASHALGTSRAIELGETEGAMSGLSIALTGIFTVLLVSVMSRAGIL